MRDRFDYRVATVSGTHLCFKTARRQRIEEPFETTSEFENRALSNWHRIEDRIPVEKSAIGERDGGPDHGNVVTIFEDDGLGADHDRRPPS